MQSDPSKSARPLPAEPANKQTTVAITLLAILLLPALVSLYTQNPVLGAVSETIAGWQTTRSLVERGDLDLDEFHPSAISYGPHHLNKILFLVIDGTLSTKPETGIALLFCAGGCKYLCPK